MDAATPSPSPSLAPSVPFTTFNNLSVIAVIFAGLSALFGVYLVLFVLAIWSTYRRSGSPFKGLRIVTIVLFVNLLIHYIVRSITFGQSRVIQPPADQLQISTIPITFIGTITTTVAGFLCDGLVAWRFYVVYGRKRWAFYVPAVAVILNLLLGLSGDFQQLSFYHSAWNYTHFYHLTAFRISAAWGWFTFITNTILSGAIIGKIIHVSRKANRNNAAAPYGESRYNTVLVAITESALVTWIGLLLYEVASLAPTGHITTAWNVGYVMICIIPIFFGISQCLITVRLGFANDGFDRESKHIIGLPRSDEGRSIQKEISITVTHETSMTSDQETEKAHDVAEV
ncbi:hypothetical protein BC835DRAFT_1418064 [Cytidiella melzeri]|nr:hypothetical protein BC835DRAFT_1418064 [Cytidiella melzeri]